MKLMILDGNSILNRAFYGVRILTTKEGLCTNAVYGFLNILERLRRRKRPMRCAWRSISRRRPSGICSTTATRRRAIRCQRSWPCSFRI